MKRKKQLRKVRVERMEKRILVVEDDKDIAELVALSLEGEYEVGFAYDGATGLRRALSESWQLVILDRMLPKLEGLEICRQIRTESQVPIIMLTALSALKDKVGGLDGGADDYIVKPFHPKELSARVRRLLRDQLVGNLTIGELSIHPSSREVVYQTQHILLSSKEFDILYYLMRQAPWVATRDEILEAVWGDAADELRSAAVVDVHIRNIRNKIGVSEDNPIVHSVRGVGYVVRAVEEPV